MNHFTWLQSPLINFFLGSARRTTTLYPTPSHTMPSYHLWLIPVPEHCLLLWLILWLVLLNPWPWTLPCSYLYKELILSSSSLVLALVPIWFNPLRFAHNLWKCSSLKQNLAFVTVSAQHRTRVQASDAHNNILQYLPLLSHCFHTFQCSDCKEIQSKEDHIVIVF